MTDKFYFTPSAGYYLEGRPHLTGLHELHFILKDIFLTQSRYVVLAGATSSGGSLTLTLTMPQAKAVLEALLDMGTTSVNAGLRRTVHLYTVGPQKGLYPIVKKQTAGGWVDARTGKTKITSTNEAKTAVECLQRLIGAWEDGD